VRKYLFDFTVSSEHLTEDQSARVVGTLQTYLPANTSVESWALPENGHRMWRAIGVIPADTMLDAVGVIVRKGEQMRDKLGLGLTTPTVIAFAVRDVSVPLEEAFPPMAIAAVGAGHGHGH
jgi:hypothetical protein